jgi:predicted MFS family arabinose efflux permease
VGVAGIAVASAVVAPRAGRPAARRERTEPRRGVRSVYALGLAAVFASAGGVGFLAFLVVYSHSHGLAEGAAGLLLAGVSLCAAAGRIGLGAHADRSAHGPLRPVAAMFAASALFYLLLITGEPAFIVAASLGAGLVGWSCPGALTLAVVQHSPDSPAWAVGVMLSGLFAGGIVGPIAVGILADHGLWPAAWAVVAVFMLLAAITVALVRRRETSAG